MIADGAGGPLDQGVVTYLLIGAFLVGWVAWWRLRGRGFRAVPRSVAWSLAGLAAILVVLALVLPPIIRPTVTTRPASTARLAILSPTGGQAFHGTVADPAKIDVRLSLSGARIITTTSTRLRPDEGHIHITIDGALVSMTYGLDQVVESIPGSHVMTVEFVALDHGPFDPRVLAHVAFVVEP
jgi:hypothetical protein